MSLKLQKRLVTLFIAAAVVLANAVALVCIPQHCASAQTIYYLDDSNDYSGGGVSYEDSEYIYRDSYTVNETYRVYQAPSYGNGDTSKTNFCAATAGTNIVGYYDRFYTNLMPNFEPGMINGGIYCYFPDVGFSAVTTVFNTLYDMMDINVGGIGTTGTGFKNGLQSYVQGQGYSLSYTSFYANSKNVNLTAFGNAINAGKVGVLLCTSYNFVYAIVHSDGQTFVSKANSTNAHIMMVYGYITINYYNNGSLFRTDTYLQASSGFGSGEQGYIKMDDDLDIEEALIVNIS